jgi:hypothetical protein
LLSQYETPLRLELSPQAVYRRWLMMLYGGAMLVMLFLTSLAFSLKLMLLLILCIALFRQWQQLQYLPCNLIQQTDADWVLTEQNGRTVNARLMDKGYVSRWLIVMYFKMSNGKQRSVVILPFMLDKNSYRRLSAYLRMTNLQQLTDE